MKTKYIILFFLGSLLFTSCKEEASIKVTNMVHNVTLQSISFNDIPLGSHILPGESSSRVELKYNTYEKELPMTSQIQFYMVKGDTRVFLKTKQYYTLNDGDDLSIIISDTTEVVNLLQ